MRADCAGDRARRREFPHSTVRPRAAGKSSWGIEFADDSPLEEGVSSEPVSEAPKFPASWENTGNFIDSGLGARQRWLKRASNQCVTDQFPTHPNREFFAALQGIKSDDQGNFRPDQ